MGQCVACTSRVKKTHELYKVTDQLYDIDETGAFRDIILKRELSFQHLQSSIRNTVKYHFVTPKLYINGLDQITKDILSLLTQKLGVQVINFTTYQELQSIKDSPRVRNVLIHIVQSGEDIKKVETLLFDVIICLDAKELPAEVKEQYLLEQVDRFAILTKSAQYQELERQ